MWRTPSIPAVENAAGRRPRPKVTPGKVQPLVPTVRLFHTSLSGDLGPLTPSRMTVAMKNAPWTTAPTVSIELIIFLNHKLAMTGGTTNAIMSSVVCQAEYGYSGFQSEIRLCTPKAR